MESTPRTALNVKASGVFWTGVSTGHVTFRDDLVYTYLDIYKDGQYVNMSKDSIFITPTVYTFISNSKYEIDRFGVEYPITWIGWRLMSIPYYAFKKVNSSYGNGQLNPDRFGGLSIGIDSYPTAGKTVEYYIDYIVVTEGAPFK